MSNAQIYDWSQAPRELLELLAVESVVYWHTPGPGPKPLSTDLCRALDMLCKAARRLRTLAEVDAEIGQLERELVTLPRPVDLEAAGRIRRRILELCQECTAEASPPHAEASPAAPCPDCVELRGRITNIYHLTLTGEWDPLATVRAVRAASGPGAPSPPAPARNSNA